PHPTLPPFPTRRSSDLHSNPGRQISDRVLACTCLRRADHRLHHHRQPRRKNGHPQQHRHLHTHHRTDQRHYLPIHRHRTLQRRQDRKSTRLNSSHVKIS